MSDELPIRPWATDWVLDTARGVWVDRAALAERIRRREVVLVALPLGTAPGWLESEAHAVLSACRNNGHEGGP